VIASRPMSDSGPRASVIVRTKNSARTLGRVLSLLRAQTVPAEIIVVDSGSSDDTLAVAQECVDLIIEIPADHFSFGRALNVGAAAASAPIHFALSSHSLPPHDRWIEQSLSKYDRPDVAGTTGAPTLPDAPEPLLTTFYQTLSDALNHPWWGFSNTGSSWRADVWATFPFDEQLPASEDKEWGLRVLAAGWTIAVDSSLSVSSAHLRHQGIRHLYERTRREFEVIGSLVPVPTFTIRDFFRAWLTDMEADAPYGGWRRRLNYYRFAELMGKYQGLKASDAPVSPPFDSADNRDPPFGGVQRPAGRI
jgi:rhamnosyltransferase